MEELQNFVPGKPLSDPCLVSCSVEAWKIRMLRAMQMMETCLACEISEGSKDSTRPLA